MTKFNEKRKKKKRKKRKGLFSPKSILKLCSKVDYSVKALCLKTRQNLKNSSFLFDEKTRYDLTMAHGQRRKVF